MTKPLIKNFGISQRQVKKGEAFQIQWTTEGADKVEIFRNGNLLTTVLSNVEHIERKEFYDSEDDVVYHLVVHGGGGSVKSDSMTVSLLKPNVKDKKHQWIVWAVAGIALTLLAWLVVTKFLTPGKVAPVSIVLLGHSTHGKSTLAAAISKNLENKNLTKFVSYEDISNPKAVEFQGVRINAALIEWTQLKPYVLIDFKDDAECKKLMKDKAVKLDGAIVVIAATDGPMPQTREQLQMAYDKGIRSLIVFINKVDQVNDPELLQLVQMEAAALTSSIGFDPAQVSIIKGSALMALNGADDITGTAAVDTLLQKLASMY